MKNEYWSWSDGMAEVEWRQMDRCHNLYCVCQTDLVPRAQAAVPHTRYLACSHDWMEGKAKHSPTGRCRIKAEYSEMLNIFLQGHPLQTFPGKIPPERPRGSHAIPHRLLWLSPPLFGKQLAKQAQRHCRGSNTDFVFVSEVLSQPNWTHHAGDRSWGLSKG